MNFYIFIYTIHIWKFYINDMLYFIYTYICKSIYSTCVCVYICLCEYSGNTSLVLPLERNDGSLLPVELNQWLSFAGQTEIFFFVLFLLFCVCLLCLITFLFQGFYLQKYITYSLYTCSKFSFKYVIHL